MSQSRQSNATATAHVGTSPDADTLVEAYAEDLMDDIFEDVDRILSGDDSAIYTETFEQPATAPPLKAEAVTVPTMIVPFTTDHQSVESDPSAPMTEATPSQMDVNQSAFPNQTNKRSWGTLVLGFAGLSAVAALGFWWIRYQPLQQTATVPPSAVSTTPTVSEEIAFGEYLKRSLRVISGERSATTESQEANIAAVRPVEAPTSHPINKPSGVIERVFVPLLQPNTTNINQSGTNQIGNRPPAPAPTVAAAPSLPAPTNPTNPQSSPDSATESSTDQPSSSQTTAAVPNIATTANTYELVGVLELGDRSAALFDINGTSQRVYIGESIGGSGWSIASINNEEVVVRRNGEVRSIYIGQKF